MSQLRWFIYLDKTSKSTTIIIIGALLLERICAMEFVCFSVFQHSVKMDCAYDLEREATKEIDDEKASVIYILPLKDGEAREYYSRMFGYLWKYHVVGSLFKMTKDELLTAVHNNEWYYEHIALRDVFPPQSEIIHLLGQTNYVLLQKSS